MTVRTRTFLGVFLASSLALGVSTLLVSLTLQRELVRDVEDGLRRQALLAAELLGERETLPDPDGEADRIGALLDERVTFLDAEGRVLGDSDVDGARLADLEPHGDRPEITAARAGRVGTARRRSTTTGFDTMYAAVAVRKGPVAIVRVALPLTAVDARLAEVRRHALTGLAAGLVAAALLTWVASARLGRRLEDIAEAARRYRDGDFSRPARDHGRDEIGLVANVLDDTVRELAARLAETTRQRARIEAILAGMAEGLVLVEAGGRVALVNPAVGRLLDLSGDAVGRPVIDVIRQPAIVALLSAALAGERPDPVEVALDSAGVRVVGVDAVPVDPAREGGAVLVIRDLSERRLADRMRRDFVANVSHELRTPITAIRGAAEAVAEDAGPDAARFLAIITRQTERLERLVRDLLRLARLDARHETLDRAPCRVSDVTAAASHDLQALLAARGQRLAVIAAPDANDVTGDAAKLQDALRNLIENASHHSPDGGAIEVASVRDGEAVRITVADRGSGIPEADLLRVFERFYRADRAHDRHPAGTGLGLSIVRRLVELHGGRVTAANRPGGGAIFTITLPVAPPA